MKNNPKKTSFDFAISHTDDGNIKIELKFPWKAVKKEIENTLKRLAKQIEIPGFRKGKAPPELIKERVSENVLFEQTITKLLGKALSQIIVKEKLKLAIYPRITVKKADFEKDWEIEALTCEIPKVTLSNYKQAIIQALRKKNLWTPEKGKESLKDKKLSQEEKEQIVLNALIESTNIKIPKLLIEEETNTRISNLLSRLEKLGISLESYLSSVGKTAKQLRDDYQNLARQALIIDLALAEVAREEDIKISEEEVEKILQNSAEINESQPEEKETKKTYIKRILEKKKTLERLVSFVDLA